MGKILAEASQSPMLSVRARRQLLRLAGLDLAHDVDVKDRVRFVNRNTTIGRGTRIGRYCYFEDHAPVIIGSEVSIAGNCKFQTASHELGGADRRASDLTARPIVVGDGAWLGAGVIVLPGVTIGAGSVVGAGAVVTQDTEPNGLYVGVPARWRRSLPIDADKARIS